MNPNKLTEASQAALQEAQTLAQRRSHQGVDLEHLAVAILTHGLILVITTTGGIIALTRVSVARAARAGELPLPD